VTGLLGALREPVGRFWNHAKNNPEEDGIRIHKEDRRYRREEMT
jgi:hypothetical protein